MDPVLGVAEARHPVIERVLYDGPASEAGLQAGGPGAGGGGTRSFDHANASSSGLLEARVGTGIARCSIDREGQIISIVVRP